MRIPLAAVLLAVASVPARAAADPYAAFPRFADAGSLKPFTRDLGGLMGAATFHGGRSLGFSGWDVGMRYGAQFYPSRGNSIMRNAGVSDFGLPLVQAEIGLPFNFDGFIRGVSYQGLTVSGGGLRYGLYSPSDKPWTPQLLISGSGHSAVHQSFSATHLGANVVLSAGKPAFQPYAGAGFDRTRLVVRQSLLDPTLNGMAVETFEGRYTAGVRVRPYQFIYVNAAYVLAHGQSGGELGLGARF